jgi:sugar phosphate isomerase/epimerase
MNLSLTIQTPEVISTVPVALLEGSLSDKFSKAVLYGANGIELMTTNPGELRIDNLTSMLKEFGLEIAAIASGAMAFATGITLLHSDYSIAHTAKRRLSEMIELAAAVDSPIVTIGSFRGRLSNLRVNGRQHLRDILRGAADHAYEREVKLALEPINHFETDYIFTAEQGLDFVREVNRPAFGLLLDTFHMNIEESSWTEPFRLLMETDTLLHVHIGDNNRRPPGKGMIDFRSIVRFLVDLGYQGYLSAELLAIPDPDIAAQQTMSYMRALLEEIS